MLGKKHRFRKELGMMEKKNYAEMVKEAAEQIAEILEGGETVEISRSRSGIKLIKSRRRYEQIRKTPAGK